jgi:hypothetical protein
MASVIFDIAEFRAVYPQFTEELFSDALLEFGFQSAVALLGNSDAASVFPYDPDKGVYDRKIAIYAWLCHQLTLALQARNGQSGPVASASEGSVSVSFAVPAVDQDSYYLQTPCGQYFLQLVAKYSVGGVYVGPDCDCHPWG